MDEATLLAFQDELEKIADGDEEERGTKPPEKKLRALAKKVFSKDKSPSDEELHEKAEEAGVHPSHLEEHVYKMVGKTAQKHEHVPDESYDQEQLARGIEVEKEHTDSPEKAKEISKDHLSELPDYYSRLDRMEEEGKKSLKKAAAVALFDELEKIAGSYSKKDIKDLREIYKEWQPILEEDANRSTTGFLIGGGLGLPTGALVGAGVGSERFGSPIPGALLGGAVGGMAAGSIGAIIADVIGAVKRGKERRELVKKEDAIHKGKPFLERAKAVDLAKHQAAHEYLREAQTALRKKLGK